MCAPGLPCIKVGSGVFLFGGLAFGASWLEAGNHSQPQFGVTQDAALGHRYGQWMLYCVICNGFFDTTPRRKASQRPSAFITFLEWSGQR